MQTILRRPVLGLSCLLLSALAVAQQPSRSASPPASTPVAVHIDAQPLDAALNTWAAQTGYSVLVPFERAARGKMAPRVSGSYSPEAALQLLLAGSGLEYRFINDRTVSVRQKGTGQVSQVADGVQAMRLAQTVPDDAGGTGESPGVDTDERDQSATSTDNTATTVKREDEEDPEREGIPEILVTGSKLGTLNMDIRRTENDIQPYVIFDREKIARSGAANLEEFFKNQLTTTASVLTAAQEEAFGNKSRVNLRGLGAEETLILIDGRRAAGFNFDGTPQQPDINGIPLSAVERIEVLPTTASGLFGGGATGGVVNIVLRRDYVGLETQLTYANSFQSDVRDRRLDLSAGYSLEGGRTNILVAGSYSDANPLLVYERDLVQRGRQHILSTNPTFLFDLPTPPLGATPNIRSTSGANLTLDDNTELNSPITYTPVGYAGIATDQGAAFIANAGQYNLELAPTAQDDGGRTYALLSAPEVKSLMATLRREFTSHVQAFIEVQTSDSQTQRSANYSDFSVTIPGNAPNNPFQQAIRVTVPTVGMDESVVSEAEDLRAVAGVIVQLPRKWRAAIDHTWNRSRSSYERPRRLSATTVAAAQSGSLDVLRDVNQFPLPIEGQTPDSQSPGDMTLENTAFHLAGPLSWSLPGGNPVISLLVEHREESLSDVTTVSGGTVSLVPARSQIVDSVYLEARLPFVSASNRIRALSGLELQLALRGDDYTVKGATPFINTASPAPIDRFTNKNSSIDPTIGLRYQPTRDLAVRTSYGTGYLPPSMTQLAPRPPRPRNLAAIGITDPLRGNEVVGTVEVLSGGNPNLRPEESESWAVGLVFTPRAAQGLRASVDWSLIEKVDNIDIPFLFTQADLETLINFFPERVTRGDSSAGFSVGPITRLDNTLANIAKTQVEAIDVALDYELETKGIGTWNLAVDGTRLVSFETQAAPKSPVIQTAGLLLGGDSNLKWRANGSLNWTYREWTLGWRTRFFDSYFFDPSHTINPNQGTNSVASQIYHDIYGSYRFADSSSIFSMLADAELQFGINNIFDKEPPVDVVSGGLAVMYSRLGDPRLANYYLAFRTSFGR